MVWRLPVGTPPNLIAIGMIDDLLGIHINFVDWMLLAAPVSVVLLIIVFVYLNLVGRAGARRIAGVEQIVAERRAALGPWKPGERNAIVACLVTVCLWVGPGLLALVVGRDDPLAQLVLASVPEAVAALIGVVVLFVLPISSTSRGNRPHRLTGVRSCCSAAGWRLDPCRRQPVWPESWVRRSPVGCPPSRSCR